MRDRMQRTSSRHDTHLAATLEQLLPRVAQGEDRAFEQFCHHLSSPVFGLIHRGPAQSEEVAQEVFLELWRTARRCSTGLGSVRSWAMMLAHRRAVDRVRTAQAGINRDTKAAHTAPPVSSTR